MKPPELRKRVEWMMGYFKDKYKAPFTDVETERVYRTLKDMLLRGRNSS